MPEVASTEGETEDTLQAPSSIILALSVINQKLFLLIIIYFETLKLNTFSVLRVKTIA